MPGSSDPDAPRLAATMLVVRDDPFEVLTVRRHANAVFPSAVVFPGGVVDVDDYDDAWLPLLPGAEDLGAQARAIRVAGVRETFEETSLLLAAAPGAPGIPWRAPTGRTFRESVLASGAVLMIDQLLPVGHWITPVSFPRRFDTHFLLARAPRGQEAVADGREITDVEWARPSDLVERAQHGDRSIMLPTFANLLRLAESDSTAEAIAKAASYEPFTVLSQIQRLPDGTLVTSIPAEAGYGFVTFPLEEP